MTPLDSTPDRPSSCDAASVALSALLDDELPHLDRLDAIDHLAVCQHCRRFYRRARDFDVSLAALEGEGLEEPVSELMWSRVAAATEPAADTEQEPAMDTRAAIAPLATRKPSKRLWLSSLAAMALLASSLWLMQRLHPLGATQSAVYELRLEEIRGQMTEERFVALTTEVLRADRRYHHKMLEVMNTVADRTRLAEGTVGDTTRRPESREARRNDERFDDRTIH